MECAGRRFPGRPRVERSPPVAPRLEDRRLGLHERALVLQMKSEEGHLDLRAEVLARGRPEINVAELLPRPAAPTAVPPRAHHEEVVGLRVVLLQLAIDQERTV